MHERVNDETVPLIHFSTPALLCDIELALLLVLSGETINVELGVSACAVTLFLMRRLSGIFKYLYFSF